ATHSFISATFIAQNNLHITLMKDLIVVSSPGKKMKTRKLSPKVNINIRGVDFPSSLIVLESKGLDIILGMDWLGKYKGEISCGTKSIHFTHSDGQVVEYKATTEIIDNIQLNKAQADEEISVVNEFPAVFPE